MNQKALIVAARADGFASLVVLERAAETEAEAILDQISETMDEGVDAPEIQDPLLRRLQDDASDG